MAKFSDKTGREWPVVVTVGALRRVIDRTGINLHNLFGGESSEGNATELSKVLANPIVICDVVYALVAPTAQDRNVTIDAFGELLEGDILTQATEAMTDALCVFFSGQNAVKGKTLRRMLANVHTATDEIWDRAAAIVDKVDARAEANAAFDRALAIFGEPGTLGVKSG